MSVSGTGALIWKACWDITSCWEGNGVFGLQSCVPLFTGSSWKLAGHSNAAAVDEEQMLSQTKVNMACRG